MVSPFAFGNTRTLRWSFRRRSVVNLAVVALVATSVAIPIGAAAASGTNAPATTTIAPEGVAILNEGGATSASDGLEIWAGGGQIQVYRYAPAFAGGGADRTSQVFPGGGEPAATENIELYNGIYLWLGDDPAHNDGATFIGPDTDPFTVCLDPSLPCTLPSDWSNTTTTGGSFTADQSGTSHQIVSTMTYSTPSAGDFVVTATYTYSGFDDQFNVSIDVATPVGNEREVKVYQLIDALLLGDDQGAGFLDTTDPATPMIGVKKFDSNGTLQMEALRNNGPEWAGYSSRYYECVMAGHTIDRSGSSLPPEPCDDRPLAAAQFGGDMWQGSTAIDPNPDTDNGFGAAWHIDPAGTGGADLDYDLLFSISPSVAPGAYIEEDEVGNLTPCSTPTYTTIQAAVTAASASEHVHLCPGEFREASTITIDKPLTIRGDDAATTTITGVSPDEIDAHSIISTTADLTVENLTFSDGFAYLEGGAISADGDVTVLNSTFVNNTSGTNGGAIYATGSVSVTDSLFTGNHASSFGEGTYRGGAIYSELGVLVDGSTFENNSAAAEGGAIYVPELAGGLSTKSIDLAGLGDITPDASSPSVMAIDSRFMGNSAVGDGGAIHGDNAYVLSSTFELNRAWGTGRGGAIALSGIASTYSAVVNSTFHFNDSVGAGGAISTDGKLTVVHATFQDNHSDDETLATAIAAPGANAVGSPTNLEVANSLFLDGDVENPSPGCTSELGIVDDGGNIDTQAAATAVLSGYIDDGCVDPEVTTSSASVDGAAIKNGGLEDNGGPTETIEIASDSIAAGYAVDAVCSVLALVYGTPTAIDQRGEPRTTPCDTGAYEAGAAAGPDDLWVWTEIGPSEYDVYGVGTSCEDDSALPMQDYAEVAFQYAADHVASGGTVHVCDGYYPFASPVTVATEDVEFKAQEYEWVDLDATDFGDNGLINRVEIDGNFSTQLFTVSDTVDAVAFRGMTFEEGVAGSDGGGAINAPDTDVTLDTVAFFGNIATTDGGAVDARSVEIVENTGHSAVSAVFEYNASNDGGTGGDGGAINAVAKVSVTHSLFIANVALGDADGGAINGQFVMATNSVFFANSTSDLCVPPIFGPCIGGYSDTDAGYAVPAQVDLTAWAAAISAITPTISARAGSGGAVHTTGADAVNTFSQDLFIANGEFTDVGGVIAVDGTGSGTTTDILYSTIVGGGMVPDFPTDVASKGGAVYAADGIVTVTNSSIQFASARVGGAIAIDDGHVRVQYTGIDSTYALGADGSGGDGSAVWVADGDQSEITTSYITNQTGLTACSFGGTSSSTSDGYNLVTWDTTCPGTKVSDAEVAVTSGPWSPLPEATNGNFFGFARALHVDAASVAVDAIPTDSPLCGEDDQYYVARPIGLGCDIGPWEAVDETVLTGTTGSFTVPNGVTTLDILLVGGGGGGAAVNEPNGDNGTGGGGGGQVVVCTNISVTPGQILDYSIGAGGAEGVDGGTTEVTDHDTGFLIPGCTASGGYTGTGIEAGGGGNGSGGSGLKSGTPAATGGGGGGAGGDGDNAVSENVAGDGGSGVAPNGGYFTSYPTLLGGGGGGGGWSSLEQGYGGAGVAGGGGGAGTQGYPNIGPASVAGDGTDGTGGGGGGAALGEPAGSGGDGTIIIRTAVPLPGVDTVTTTQVSRTSFTIGGSVTDTATVTAASPSAPLAQRIAAAALGTPTGDVEWYYCFDETTMPTSCDDTTGTYIDTVSLDVNGVATLTSQPSRAGKYLFHAVYLGDDDYNSSADDGTNESFTVNKAVSTIVYTGTQYFPSATSSVVLSAQVGGAACRTGSVDFYADGDGDGTYETYLGSGSVSGTTGIATYSWSLLTNTGVFDVEAYYPGDANCTDAVVTSTIIIASQGDSSNGGGNYNQNGKVNFGYTVQVKTTTKGTTVTGQMLWHLNGKVRIKGTITAYAKLASCPSQTPSLTGTTCGLVTGSGTLYTWSGVGHGGWVKVATGVGFKVYVADGGTSTVCVKKTCSTVLKPDFFKMDVPTQTLQGESTTLQQLTGGNLIVK